MNHICVNAHAKINLALDVLGKRQDGYHELQTIMQTLYLHDIVFIKKTSQPGITINCNTRRLPKDGRNLAYKAAQQLLGFESSPGVYIDITKEIPISAGLAGGSSDCAATLLGIREVFDLPVTDMQLHQIAARLGADVPYCLTGRTALATGIGEILTPIADHPVTIVALAKPLFARVSTATIFSSFKMENVQQRPDINRMIKDIERKNIESVAQGFCNVLESVTEAMHPVIADIKRCMRESGALNALMSGSGPCVFGFFYRKKDAINAMKLIKRTVPTTCGFVLTSTYCPGQRFPAR